MPKKVVRFPSDFPRELLVPLPRRRQVGFFGNTEITQEWSEEFDRRVRILCSYYGIGDSPDRLSSVALRALFAFVPGLQEATPKRVGRKRDAAGPERRKRLLSAVEALRRSHPSFGDTQACRTLRKDRSSDFFQKGLESLRKQVRRARSERVVRNVALGKVLQGILGDQPKPPASPVSNRPCLF